MCVRDLEHFEKNVRGLGPRKPRDTFALGTLNISRRLCVWDTDNFYILYWHTRLFCTSLAYSRFAFFDIKLPFSVFGNFNFCSHCVRTIHDSKVIPVRTGKFRTERLPVIFLNNCNYWKKCVFSGCFISIDIKLLIYGFINTNCSKKKTVFTYTNGQSILLVFFWHLECAFCIPRKTMP